MSAPPVPPAPLARRRLRPPAPQTATSPDGAAAVGTDTPTAEDPEPCGPAGPDAPDASDRPLLDRLAAPLREALWRGDQLARPGAAVQPSGHAALDAELPGGGWPCGRLIELLCSGPGIGEWRLLAPALAALAAAGREVLCIAPPHAPHGPALAALGLPLGRLLWVQMGDGPSGGLERAAAGTPAGGAVGRPAVGSVLGSAGSPRGASIDPSDRRSRDEPQGRRMPGDGGAGEPPPRQPTGRSIARPLPNRLADAAWAAEQALQSGACGAVLWWVPATPARPSPGSRTAPRTGTGTGLCPASTCDARDPRLARQEAPARGDALRPEMLRRLHLAAQGSDTLLFLMRPLAAARQSSPAPLRLLCRPLNGAASGDLEIELLKRRGPACARPLRLPLSAQLPASLRQGLRRRRQQMLADKALPGSAHTSSKEAVLAISADSVGQADPAAEGRGLAQAVGAPAAAALPTEP